MELKKDMCEHKTIPPLKTGVISIPLMVEYKLYNEAVDFDNYKDCFSCWIKQSDFVRLFSDVAKLYLTEAS